VTQIKTQIAISHRQHNMSVFITQHDGQYYCKCYDEIQRLQEEIMAGVQTLTAKIDDAELPDLNDAKWQEVVDAGWVQVGCSRVVLARRAGVDEMALPWSFEAPAEPKKVTKRARGGLSNAQKRKPVAGSSKKRQKKDEQPINIPDSDDDEEEYTPPALENFIPARESIVVEDEETIRYPGPLFPKTTTAADGPGETYYSQTQRSELTNNDLT
jgi:hypothetical protein